MASDADGSPYSFLRIYQHTKTLVKERTELARRAGKSGPLRGSAESTRFFIPLRALHENSASYAATDVSIFGFFEILEFTTGYSVPCTRGSTALL